MVDSIKRTGLTRREALILSSTAGIGVATANFASASDTNRSSAQQTSGSISTPRSAIAKTQYGKVRGYLDDGVLTFKGVPYGQTTAGENRWLPAKAPTPWNDELPTLTYGANCPQNLHPWTATEQTFIQDWVDGWLSEDMLKLNIWTPSLSGKRPVMVYRLVSKGTVEERILGLQEKKKALFDAAMGEASAAASLTKDDLLALLA